MAVGLVVLGVIVGVALTNLWRFVTRRHPLDALTGLPGRGAAHDALADLRTGDAVVMLDLDELKQLNDTAGHAAGDAALKALAGYLAKGVRAQDVVVRWGGDEFVVVLRGGGAAAADVVERLRASAPSAFSAGIAIHTGGDGQATLTRADAALLAAKRAGGRRVMTA